jgi:hypothetical protein
MGIDAISGFMKQFGFGSPTGIDLEHEKTGVLPSQEWKRERFKRNRAAQKWVGGDTISISIGNGYNNYTMLQLAHAVATLANDGVMMKPHLVKMLEDGGQPRAHADGAEGIRPHPAQAGKHRLHQARDGGRDDRAGGTGYKAFTQRRLAGGKTGTAQVVGLKGAKYNARHDARAPARQRLFTAFAPADKPRIAIALVVENAGFRRGVAAPIARKALDYYLLGKRPGDKEAGRPSVRAKEDPADAGGSRSDRCRRAQAAGRRNRRATRSKRCAYSRAAFAQPAPETLLHGVRRPAGPDPVPAVLGRHLTMSSAGHDFPGRMEGQMRNILLSFVVMWIAANIPPQMLLRLAVPIYTFGVTLLVAVALFGTIKKGARRWLHVGVDIQPSEIMKIATPLMLAWYFQSAPAS